MLHVHDVRYVMRVLKHVDVFVSHVINHRVENSRGRPVQDIQSQMSSTCTTKRQVDQTQATNVGSVILRIDANAERALLLKRKQHRKMPFERAGREDDWSRSNTPWHTPVFMTDLGHAVTKSKCLAFTDRPTVLIEPSSNLVVVGT